ncbi:MAG: pentapeptide repeat-containing protein, partial [Waterburya sp.]
MNAAELLRQYQFGVRNFQRVDLAQVILQQANLSQIDLS